MSTMNQTGAIRKGPARVLRWAWHYWGRISVGTWLLVALALLTALGSFFPRRPADLSGEQLQRWQMAAEDKFGPLARVLEGLGLFTFFRSPWFWVPAGALALSLLICTLIRLRPVWRSGTGRGHAPSLERLSRYPCRARMPAASQTAGLSAARSALRHGRLHPIEVLNEEGTMLQGERNRLARLGTLATHLAPLLLLVGVTITGLTSWRETVTVTNFGGPVPVGPAGAFQVRVHQGYVERYPDGSLADYGARIAIMEGGKTVRERDVRANHPLRYRGVSLLLMECEVGGKVTAAELLAVQDHGRPVAIAAGVLLVVGVCLTFYLPHQQIWAWTAADGALELVGRTTGDRVSFERVFDRVVERAQSALVSHADSSL
jgi:cytochrome c biogenesis protein